VIYSISGAKNGPVCCLLLNIPCGQQCKINNRKKTAVSAMGFTVERNHFIKWS